MAEQRAIGLVHALAPPLALGVVGFRDRDGDPAVVVPRHDVLAGDGVLEELEDQPLLRVLGPSPERQLQRDQRIEQPMLGDLDQPPEFEVSGLGEIGHRVIVAAGDAEMTLLIGRDQPVADVVLGIGAEPEGPGRIALDLPEMVRHGPDPDHGVEVLVFRTIAEAVPALLAGRVLEIQSLIADLTIEQFHVRRSSTSRRRSRRRAGPTRHRYATPWSSARFSRSPSSAGGTLQSPAASRSR